MFFVVFLFFFLEKSSQQGLKPKLKNHQCSATNKNKFYCQQKRYTNLDIIITCSSQYVAKYIPKMFFKNKSFFTATDGPDVAFILKKLNSNLMCERSYSGQDIFLSCLSLLIVLFFFQINQVKINRASFLHCLYCTLMWYCTVDKNQT